MRMLSFSLAWILLGAAHAWASGTVTGVIKVGSQNLADGKVVTCIDASAPHPTSTIPSNGIPGSGRYQCNGVANGSYLLSVDGVEANPSGTCPDVNNNTVVCNATVGGTCGNPSVTFTTAMLPATLATCLVGRRGRRRGAVRRVREAVKRRVEARGARSAALMVGILCISYVGARAQVFEATEQATSAVRDAVSTTGTSAELCAGRPYSRTLNTYVTAWQRGSDDDIDALASVLAPSFRRSHGGLQSIQREGGDSALVRVGSMIRAFRSFGSLGERDLHVAEVSCSAPSASTAIAVLRWVVEGNAAIAGTSTLTFDLTATPVRITQEEVGS